VAENPIAWRRLLSVDEGEVSVDLFETSKREKRQTFMVAIFVALAAMVLQPVVAQAVTRVRGTVTAKVKDTGGGRVDARSINPGGLGITDAPGSRGAMDTRTFPGGAGLLDVADCQAATPIDNTAEVGGNHVVSDLLLTGTDGTVTVTSDAVGGGALPLLVIRVDASTPNVLGDLATGLAVTAPLTFTAAGTNCNLIVLGTGN
jgi:hypothetical protein